MNLSRSQPEKRFCALDVTRTSCQMRLAMVCIFDHYCLISNRDIAFFWGNEIWNLCISFEPFWMWENFSCPVGRAQRMACTLHGSRLCHCVTRCTERRALPCNQGHLWIYFLLNWSRSIWLVKQNFLFIWLSSKIRFSTLTTTIQRLVASQRIWTQRRRILRTTSRSNVLYARLFEIL